MLLGKKFGGSHQSALQAVFGGQPAAGGGNQGFARTNIPLDQAVHGAVGAQVGKGVVDGPLLCPGGGKGQGGVKFLGVVVDQRAGGVLPASPLYSSQPQAEGKQFLEDETAAGIFKEVSEELPELTILKVNVDEHQALAAQFGITAIPTMIEFKKGNRVNLFKGYLSKEDLVIALTK